MRSSDRGYRGISRNEGSGSCKLLALVSHLPRWKRCCWLSGRTSLGNGYGNVGDTRKCHTDVALLNFQFGCTTAVRTFKYFRYSPNATTFAPTSMFEARKLMSRMPYQFWAVGPGSRLSHGKKQHGALPTNPQKLVATGENILTLVEIITVD